MVFQDPYASMNPRVMIKDLLFEPIRAHKILPREKVIPYIVRILREVGLDKEHLTRFPHEFSGGQRQRIAIARALVSRPQFVILDEPTSAVDVSVRAQLLGLFTDLSKEMKLTYMFISHDLSIVECISHRVAIMYLGQIVEFAATDQIFHDPLHPYAQALIASVPIPDPDKRKDRAPLTGEVPSPINPPQGCRFHPRCPIAMDICRKEPPEMLDVGEGHYVSCFAVHQRTSKPTR